MTYYALVLLGIVEPLVFGPFDDAVLAQLIADLYNSATGTIGKLRVVEMHGWGRMARLIEAAEEQATESAG